MSVVDLYPVRASEKELGIHLVKMVGTGASAPTKVYGQGVTIARTSEGLYTATWSSNPGVLVDVWWTVSAATPGAVAGYSVQPDTFATSSPWVLPFLLSEADSTVVDLAALQYISLACFFKS